MPATRHVANCTRIAARCERHRLHQWLPWNFSSSVTFASDWAIPNIHTNRCRTGRPTSRRVQVLVTFGRNRWGFVLVTRWAILRVSYSISRIARRYQTSAGTTKYVALYHLASPGVVDSHEWKQASGSTPMPQHVRDQITGRLRLVCRNYVRA
jgi:hypothetical protein